MKATRTRFRCVLVDPENPAIQLCTGIMVNVPVGLNRHEAINFVADLIANDVRRYAAAEALGLAQYNSDTRWVTSVT